MYFEDDIWIFGNIFNINAIFSLMVTQNQVPKICPTLDFLR